MTSKIQNPKSKIGLALGGGVVRGMAHLGVLRVLEQAGIHFHCVTGTSAGALMGALYCAGLGAAGLHQLATQVGWRDIASLVWPRQGFVSFAKLEKWLVSLLGDLQFSDLRVPLAVMATDLRNGDLVVLQEGRLAPAVRASCSVPGFVVPLAMDGRLLGDGGVRDNLPVAAARAMGADYVIAVDLVGPKFDRRTPLGIGFAALEILIEEAGGGRRTADCLITPDLCDCSYLRFSQVEKLIRRGEEAAERALPQIQEVLAVEDSGR
ncbi:MAG: patatin-like phospholipase family protein [Chloroflexota bacterium]